MSSKITNHSGPEKISNSVFTTFHSDPEIIVVTSLLPQLLHYVYLLRPFFEEKKVKEGGQP